MRWIQKNNSPDNFEKWKAQEKPQFWNQLPGTLPDDRSPHLHYYSKNELRAALLEEQNSKCLYCEGCISNHPLKTRIDHVKIPQSDTQSSGHIFDYNNLGLSCNSEYLHQESEIRRYRSVTYCDSDIIPMEEEAVDNKQKILPSARHCDAHKKDQVLSFTPYDRRCEEKLQFLSDGSVLSENPDGVHVIKILNLDAVQLRNRRQGAIAGFISDGENKFIEMKKAKELYEKLSERKSLEYSKAILDSLKRLF